MKASKYLSYNWNISNCRPKKSMFNVVRKFTQSSQYHDGMSAEDSKSVGGTKVSSPSMSSDNPSFVPDEGNKVILSII